MSVTLTSPAFGLAAGDTFTGTADQEAWLLAQGYASQAGYTGPGVSNTGATDVTPAQDLTLASNREDPGEAFDFDAGGVNDEAPVLDSVSPANGAAAGGDAVTLTGSQFEGVTGVTFGGVAATSVEVVSDTEVTCVAPAHAAGAVDVVVTNPVGSDTLTGGFTYA